MRWLTADIPEAAALTTLSESSIADWLCNLVEKLIKSVGLFRSNVSAETDFSSISPAIACEAAARALSAPSPAASIAPAKVVIVEIIFCPVFSTAIATAGSTPSAYGLKLL